jgi:mRNA-decapping enzyme 1B
VYHESSVALRTGTNMSKSVKEEARRQANIRLLQRTCSPDITNIVVSGSHVVLYEYRDTAWHKSCFEGSLFVAQRGSSFYELIIMNRNSPDNFQITLDESTQLQHQEPYLIFKQASEPTVRIRGIWFHSADERVMVNTALQQTIQSIREMRRSQSAPPLVAAPVQPPASAQMTQAVANDAGAALATLFAPMSVSGGVAAAPVTHASVPDQQNSAGAKAPPLQALATPPSEIPQPGAALDKKSLQLALLSLIQDDRFLELLHQQYLRVVHARSKKPGL